MKQAYDDVSNQKNPRLYNSVVNQIAEIDDLGGSGKAAAKDLKPAEISTKPLKEEDSMNSF